MAKYVEMRPFLAIAMGLLATGCVNFSSLDDLKTAKPTGTPFSQALYKNYAFLARSFGDMGQASYVAFDQDASIPLTKTDARVAALANTYADKALRLTRGEIVDPTPSRDIKTHALRDRLVRALNTGRDAVPRDAARAQADWDCWRLNATVPALAASSEQCRRSFEVTLVRLEQEAKAAEDAAAAAAKKKEAAKAGSDAKSSASSSDAKSSASKSETP